MNPLYYIEPEVRQAIKDHLPVVALESTVITHGLPRPENLTLARDLEQEIRSCGAVPATIALLDSHIHIGLSSEELVRVSEVTNARKVSRRDFGIALAKNEVGGTTVAGTMFAAHQSGIRVFATGGIGGVHRGDGDDISADLPELGRTPMIVVCSGAKSILNLPATLEVLETLGVPTIGFGTDEFPAFFSTHSGLSVTARAETPEEIVEIARYHWDVGVDSAILVTNPPPTDSAVDPSMMEQALAQALAEADAQGIHGPATTPFLLMRVNQLTNGQTLKANLALLRSNANLAGRIAKALHTRKLPTA